MLKFKNKIITIVVALLLMMPVTLASASQKQVSHTSQPKIERKATWSLRTIPKWLCGTTWYCKTQDQHYNEMNYSGINSRVSGNTTLMKPLGNKAEQLFYQRPSRTHGSLTASYTAQDKALFRMTLDALVSRS